MTSNEVIVGVDGSAPSLHAVRWAAREAARRRLPLRVVNAHYWIVAGVYAPIGLDTAQEAEATAKLVVEDALAEARTAAPGVEVHGATVLGPPAQVLIEAGKGAALLVVGSRGHGGFAAALVGATSQQVASHAPCPVVVVRGRGDAAVGPVVVGVDGSASAAHALDLAYEQAAARGCMLVVTRAFERQSPPYGKGPVVAVDPLADLVERERADLAAVVAEHAKRYPDVLVEQLVVSGNAAQELVQLSRGAQLVVVGTRGHGGFSGLLLGSVGLHLVHHSDCPVLIARTPSNGTQH